MFHVKHFMRCVKQGCRVFANQDRLVPQNGRRVELHVRWCAGLCVQLHAETARVAACDVRVRAGSTEVAGLLWCAGRFRATNECFT